MTEKEIPFGGWAVGFKVGAEPSDMFPIKFTAPATDSNPEPKQIGLTRSEAEGLRDALTVALGATENVVQVKVDGFTARYSYRDPSGRLEVGDLVRVPFGSRDRAKTGEVVALGRNSYSGAVKDVTSRLVTEPLTA